MGLFKTKRPLKRKEVKLKKKAAICREALSKFTESEHKGGK
jgi:hypothetical protein